MTKWKPYQFASWNGVLVQILPEPLNTKFNGEKIYWVKLLSGYNVSLGKRPILGDINIAKESELKQANKDNLKVFVANKLTQKVRK